MTENDMRDLLLELNRSRTHPTGVGPIGFLDRLSREAEILHLLADESGSLVITAMAMNADVRTTAAQGMVREFFGGNRYE